MGCEGDQGNITNIVKSRESWENPMNPYVHLYCFIWNDLAATNMCCLSVLRGIPFYCMMSESEFLGHVIDDSTLLSSHGKLRQYCQVGGSWDNPYVHLYCFISWIGCHKYVLSVWPTWHMISLYDVRILIPLACGRWRRKVDNPYVHLHCLISWLDCHK